MWYTGRPVARHASSNAATFFSASGLFRSPQLGWSMAFCRSMTIKAALPGSGFGRGLRIRCPLLTRAVRAGLDVSRKLLGMPWRRNFEPDLQAVLVHPCISETIARRGWLRTAHKDDLAAVRRRPHIVPDGVSFAIEVDRPHPNCASYAPARAAIIQRSARMNPTRWM